MSTGGYRTSIRRTPATCGDLERTGVPLYAELTSLERVHVFMEHHVFAVWDFMCILTVIHSGQGTQFTSWTFTQRAVDSGLLPSMGSVGDWYDNAMIDSIWSRMQVELLNRKRWKTPVELANAIFECLEIFHNRQHRHSAPGMVSPVEYEIQHASSTAA